MKATMKAPDDKITYGVICEKDPDAGMWATKYDDAVRLAREMSKNHPDNRPYYIVERIETFEIVAVV